MPPSNSSNPGFLSRILSRFSRPERYLRAPRSAWFKRRHIVVSEETAMQVAAFNRGLIYISTQIAKLPWDVKDRDFQQIRGPIHDLLNLSPNTEMNAFRWRLCMVQQAIIHGNAYAEIERDGAMRPINLWPLESKRMQLVRDDQSNLFYQYTDPSRGPVLFTTKDIFHLANFHTYDGLVGQGVAGYGRDVLGIQIAADNMASGLFLNSGIPSGMLLHPGRLSEEAASRLKKEWIDQQGGSNTGATSILEEGMKYEPTHIDSTALQFLESRQFGVLEIARFLGVPPTKLFDVTAATYSNVEQANLEVATDTLDSWATNLEQEADVKLLNNRHSGRFTDIDLYSIFRGDMASRSSYFKTMMGVAAMTPNQIRAREGLPGYGKEGDNYYIATNNFTPVDRMDEVIDADILQKSRPAEKPAPAPEKKGVEPSPLESAAIRYLTERV